MLWNVLSFKFRDLFFLSLCVVVDRIDNKFVILGSGKYYDGNWSSLRRLGRDGILLFRMKFNLKKWKVLNNGVLV